MSRKVELSRRAQRDIDASYQYIRKDTPGRAARWRQRLLEAVGSLEQFPLRHAVAPEAEAIGLELRQMMFGTYRVLYIVEDDIVSILTVRHGARGVVEPGELADEP